MEKKMCYKVLLGSIAFTALLLFGLPVGSAGALQVVKAAEYGKELDSGTAGDNVKWTVYDSNNGNVPDTLVFSGKGELKQNTSSSTGWKSTYGDKKMVVVIESGITKIGDSAFKDCSNLTGNLVLPVTVSVIRANAFYNCSGLTGKVTIPKNVPTIPDSAFRGCSNIESIDLGNVTEIGIDAFCNCSSLSGELVLPEGITSIGTEAFKGCSQLTGTLRIPEKVTAIASSCFEETGFTAVEFPSGLKTIGTYAFQNCSQLTGTIKIPVGVTNIPDYCFEGTGITAVELPQGLKTIGKRAFRNSKLQYDIVIPEGVTGIGESAFALCTSMNNKAIVIPYSVESIGNSAFMDTKSTVYNLSSKATAPSVSNYTMGTVYTITKKYADKTTATRKFLPPGVCDNLTVYHQFPYPEYDGDHDWYQDEACTKRVDTGVVKANATYFQCGSQKLPQAPLTITIKSSASKLIYGGDPFELEVTGGSGTGAVTFSVPDKKVLSITGRTAKIMGAGTVTVTAVKAGDSTYEPISTTLEITVDPKPITDSTVKVGDIADQTYTGQGIRPTVVVTDGNAALISGTDYEIAYSNNTNVCDKSAGNAPTVTIKGQGNYTGTVSKTFTILKAKAVVTITNTSVTKTYGDEPFQLAGVTKTGDGALRYTVKSGTDVISVSENSGKVSIFKDGKAVIGVTTTATASYAAADEKTISITILECTHIGGEADCSHRAVCTHCHEEYGEFDSTRHSGTLEWEGYKEATCTEEGYTGDQHCGDCNAIVQKGSTIKKKEHIWDSGQITREPTASKDGEMLYTCTVCKTTKTDIIPKTGVKWNQTGFEINKVSGLVYGGKDFALTTKGGNTNGTVTFSVPDNNGVLVLKGAEASIIGAGTVTVTAVMAGNDDYLPATAEQDFTVSPKTITSAMVSTIADQWYTGREVKPDVEVKDGETVLTKNDYTVTYSNNKDVRNKGETNPPTATIEGKGNYTGKITRTFTIVKRQAEVTIAAGKDSITKTYGDSSFPLTGITKTGDGALSYEVISGTNVISVSSEGEVTILNAGNAEIGVSTKETVEYASAEKKTIRITVAKKLYAPYMPGERMSAESTCERIGDVVLPQYWQWKEEHKGYTLTTGNAVEATAVYTGSDKDNYEVVEINIAVTRSNCVHQLGDMLTDQEPTCEQDGYGHRVCTKCGDIIENNIPIAKLGHTGGIAYCSQRAKCDRCKEEYGSFNSANHRGDKEKRNEKEVTCTEDGYTGDLYCAGCNTKLQTGNVIKAQGHKWDDGRVTKAPTASKDGEMTYTCDVCNETRTEIIPRTGNRRNQTNFAINGVYGLVYGGKDFTLTTTGGNGGGAVTFSVPRNNGVLSLNGATASIIGAGTVTVTATKEGDEEYFPATATLSVTVSRKTISYNMVGDIEDQLYTGQQIIPNVEVKDGTTVLKQGQDYVITCENNVDVGHKWAANSPTATIQGIGNYMGEVTRTFTIMRPQAEVTIAEGKDNIIKTYGDKPFQLEGITKTGDGALIYKVKEGGKVISVSADGKVTILSTGTAKISITTSETNIYLPAKEKFINITVNKAPNAPFIPRSVMYVDKNYETIGEVVLPGEWKWSESDKTKQLVTDGQVKATALYDGTDKGNYEVESIVVTVIRVDCVHEPGDIVVNEEEYEYDREATCTQVGYGHRECTKCGNIVDMYIEIEALGHTGGEADCIHKAVCDRCQEEYGEFDNTRHTGEFERRDEKAATCTEDGYTGDVYCEECGEKAEEGMVIKAEGHKWDAGQVTKAATATQEGVMTYTCSICKVTKTEVIPISVTLPNVGATLTDSATKAKYKVTGISADGTTGNVQYVKPTGKNIKSVTVPSTIKSDGITLKVTSVAAKAFKGQKKLSKVTIGSNVTSIGAEAFSGCKALKTVKLGGNVTTIGNKAFYKCTKLTKITIPAKVTKIGSQAFGGCKALKSITIKTKKLTTKNVGKNAFKGISAKATVKVPKSKKKAYKTLLKKKGVGSKAKIA